MEAVVTGSGLRFPGETVLRTQELQEPREGRQDRVRFVLLKTTFGEWCGGREAGRGENNLEAICSSPDDK